MDLEQSLAALLVATVPTCEAALATKTLVFKPKTAKTATPVPVVVFALAATATPLGAVARLAGVKEPRLASDDLVQQFFQTSAKEVLIANLTAGLGAGRIRLLVDTAIWGAPAGSVLQVATALATACVAAAAVKAHLESTGIEVIPADFAEAAAGAGAPGAVAAAGGSRRKNAAKKDKEAAKLEDAKLIGITVDKEKDFSSWYSQVVVKGEMLDYYDVSGCYILRPNSYFVWEEIQDWFNQRIRRMGVKNSYFPMFVSSKVLEKEKDHVEGFAPEVAWVTRAGSSELDEHIAIRPTSETVMYPYYAKWIRSHRDLPLRLNQWNSVVRWEFKHPQPFLRTREFLWQEGHTAHLTKAGAEQEVAQILDLYKSIYEELLAVPVIKGVKSENEKFAGADFTTTVEGFIAATGRGIQGATSHHLGDNFSRMFNISVESPEGADQPRVFAQQNSWGLSTRVIGVMVMTHSDNKGLVLPPRVAQTQVVVIPVGLTAKSSAEQREQVTSGAEKIEAALADAGVRVVGDYRDNYSPGWKFADSELKGVPLRVEFGPKDLAAGLVTAVRRDTNEKYAVKLDDLATRIPQILDTIQKGLLEAARAKFDQHRVTVEAWEDFVPTLNAKNVILAPWCGVPECEDEIKDASAKKDDGDDEEQDERAPSMGAKSLCIPHDQPALKENQKCVRCARMAVNYTLFGRSY
ncbi:prolyl-tRNA synthetase [Metschnikowia bicuspidata var. bicuspidata NRRL YB-4993]|uniref:proline--tRNA ligase n=1 Tax=Metschnikowia bicuspidata var. bicuspidata NRRL YB-4993 TaxID=869754 RepID=A0A1A0H8I3_9ASCO|nr:prolyl-tRNA synthetase [Metschnikowia bicuspidata var. bicuspidata NRRL YB-4993]OBA20300.1 prolyl-tRNA synthetase [Metschnikowia bicuspidata var. bicuspidata NRRL YB-4993]